MVTCEKFNMKGDHIMKHARNTGRILSLLFVLAMLIGVVATLGITAAATTVAPVADVEGEVEGTQDPETIFTNLKLYGANLELTGSLTMNMRMEAAQIPLDYDVVLKLVDENDNAYEGQLEGDYYIFAIANIAAKDFGVEHTYHIVAEVIIGDTTLTYESRETKTYSPITYAKNISAKAGEEEDATQGILDALVVYAYFAETTAYGSSNLIADYNAATGRALSETSISYISLASEDVDLSALNAYVTVGANLTDGVNLVFKVKDGADVASLTLTVANSSITYNNKEGFIEITDLHAGMLKSQLGIALKNAAGEVVASGTYSVANFLDNISKAPLSDDLTLEDKFAARAAAMYMLAVGQYQLPGYYETEGLEEKIYDVDGSDEEVFGTVAIGNVYYATLAEAIAAAQAGDTIVLVSDIELDAPIVVNGTVTIELNGKTLSYTGTTQNEAMITNRGNLTINDSVGEGKIYYNYVGANDPSHGKGNYTISNRGTLTVNGGEISIANLRQHAKYPIDNNSTSSDAILVINGGHLYNYNTSAIRMFCNSTVYKNSVTINGGLVEGYSAIWMQNPGSKTVKGDLTITGGEIRTTAAAYVNGTAELKDVSSSLYATINGEGSAWSEDSFISITGGIFNENVYLAEEAPANITVDEENATFNGYIEYYVAPTGNAKIGDVYYATQAEAIAAAQAGDTIVLVSDIELDAYLVVAGTVVLDLNGKTISGDFASYYGIIYVKPGATLTINGEGAIYAQVADAIGNYGTVIVNGGNITTDADHYYGAIYNFYYNESSYGTTIINGGFVDTILNSGNLTINGGEVECIDNSGKLVVGGGTITEIIAKDGAHAAGVAGAGTVEIADPSAITITLPDGYDFVEIKDGVYQVLAHNYVGANCQTAGVCEGCGAIGEIDANVHENWTDATCQAPKTCACGETEGEALDHNYVGATCTTLGTCVNGCGEQGGEYAPHTEYVDEVVNATCTAGGHTTYGCENCDWTEERDFTDALSHDWVDATCTAPKTCTECGETDGEALGHDIVILPGKDATCTETGLTEGQYCKNCDDETIEQEEIPASHNYVDGECSKCGWVEAVNTQATVTVNIKDVASENGWNNSYKYATFTWEGITFTAAGSSNTGKYYTDGNQSRFYQSERVKLTISTNGINIVSVKITYVANNSGCLVYGGSNIASGAVVTVNGTSVTLSVGNTGSATNGQARITAIEVVYGKSVEAHFHNFVGATCEAPATCSVCGKTDGEALGHTEVIDEAVDATCTETGLTEGSHCSVCDAVIVAQVEVPATGHNFVDGVCTGCGDEQPAEGEGGVEITVSKSHTDIAGIAGVTAGQNTGSINGKTIALDENISIVCAKGGSTSNPCVYDESIRLYQNGATLTITAENDKIIKSVVITLATKSGGQGPITVTGGTASALQNYVYTITANADTDKIVITTAGTSSSARLYVANIEVVYA